jgi:plasmid replication initiation protein
MTDSRVRLALKSREDFAALNLHDKNDYLQTLARQFCEATGRPIVTLDKDTLGRLRRFYSRRRLADLRVNELPDNDLGRALRGLGEAIKTDERKQDLLGMLKVELPGPAPVLREAPIDDAQLAFFVPTLYDAPVKDDVNLMDVAPFSLSKNKRSTLIRYELKDSIITVDGSAEHGLATVFDYDIFLHMVSYLAEEYRRYKIEEGKGRRPDLPSYVYRPSTAHILKFCRRSVGGRQYRELEAALDRLAGTRIKIVNLTSGKRREAINIPLIDKYRVVSKTTSDHVDEVEIYIPTWVYQSVVRREGHPKILTLNPDYFLISQGIGRVIYRLARRAAGKGEAKYRVSEVHRRSGSSQSPPHFLHMLRQLVANTRAFPLPDYDLELIQGQQEPLLRMSYRGERAVLFAPGVVQLLLN